MQYDHLSQTRALLELIKAETRMDRVTLHHDDYGLPVLTGIKEIAGHTFTHSVTVASRLNPVVVSPETLAREAIDELQREYLSWINMSAEQLEKNLRGRWR